MCWYYTIMRFKLIHVTSGWKIIVNTMQKRDDNTEGFQMPSFSDFPVNIDRSALKNKQMIKAATIVIPWFCKTNLRFNFDTSRSIISAHGYLRRRTLWLESAISIITHQYELWNFAHSDNDTLVTIQVNKLNLAHYLQITSSAFSWGNFGLLNYMYEWETCYTRSAKTWKALSAWFGDSDVCMLIDEYLNG